MKTPHQWRDAKTLLEWRAYAAVVKAKLGHSLSDEELQEAHRSFSDGIAAEKAAAAIAANPPTTTNSGTW